MRLLDQVASTSVGRRALSFLWNITRLRETPVKSQSLSTGPENVYTVELQPSVEGPEYKKDVEQKRYILRKSSLLRYLSLDDGKLTVMMHTTLQRVAKVGPYYSTKSEDNTMLLLLAKVGQVSLNLHRIFNLQRQIDILAADTFGGLRQVTVDAMNVDPDFLNKLVEYREKVEKNCNGYQVLEGTVPRR